MVSSLLSRRRGPLGGALLLASLLLSTGTSHAQTVDTYTFAPSTGTFTPLATATATVVPSLQADDAVSADIPLGFSFVFDGTTYTSCRVSSNGWLSFNPTTTSSSLTNDLATGAGTERPLIAPFWDDLDGRSGPVPSYATTGTAPNRTFTFEWLNWYRYGNTGGASFSMQVQLVEGTNVVRLVYRQEPNAISNATASIGLSGVGSGPNSFLSLSDASASPTVSSTVETNSISARPATGQIYSFTPPPPASCVTPRNLTASNITANSAQVAWTVTGGTGPFTIQYGPTGFNPAVASSPTNFYTTVTGVTASPYTITGLTASTQYQFYVTQNCGGTNGNSNRSNAGGFQSACITPLYATLPVLESFENTWISRCDTRDVPTNNWRNTPITGNNSWRREDDGAAAVWGSPNSYAYTPTGSQGTHSARFHSGQASAGLIGTMDLFVNMSAAGAKRLSFDYINTSGSDSLIVQLSNDGGVTFSRLAGYNTSGTASAFVTQVLPISSTSATAVIRFRGRADFGSTDIGLDNIILESATGCLTPAVLTVTGTTATSASVSWLTGGPGTYTVFYGPTGFNPAQPVSATNVYTISSGITAPPYNITGLTPSTQYQFYVRQDCGGTTTSGIAGPVSFATACITPLYATLPVVESFENTWISRCDTRDVPTNNWRNTPGTGNNSWRREDDGTAGAWVSPTSYAYTPTGSQGTHSARFHSGQASSGLIGTMDLFVNLSAAGAKRLSFDYINTSGTDSLIVQLSNDGGLTFSRLAGYNTSGTAAAFVTQVLPISSTSATAVLRFRGRADFGVTDIGLDNIILESATGCLTPAVLTATTTTTTAALTWLTGGPGTYTVVYGPTGFTFPTGGTTVTGLTGPPYNITGLTPGTTYQFYVTQNCGGTTTSGTAGPATFTTQIVNDEPCGATVLTVNNTCTPTATTTLGATNTPSTVYAGGTQGAGCGSITSPRDVWFRFTTAATGPTSTQVRISVTGGPASVVRAYSGTACTGPLTYINCSGTAANTAAPNLDLTALTPSTTYYIRVNEYSTAGTLGNFTICATPVPNCPAPAGLTATNLTNTTATLGWSATSGGTGSTFTVIYGPTGFSPTAGGTTVSGITGNSTNITGLSPTTTYQFYVQQVCGGFNGSSTLTGPFSFTTPLTAPANDEPCGATPLGTASLTSSNVGATTSVQNGINLPACSSAQLPKDVWFTFTPTGTSTTLTLTGSAAGMLRVFTSPSCSAGPFNQVFCASSGTANTAITGPVVVTGLTANTRYYIAVSGYGSSDTAGSFTLAGSGLATATKAQAETDALVVYPNPSNTGQLALRLSGVNGNGKATLLNALGQEVLTKALSGAGEQTLTTRGLAAGLYTLRVTVAGQVLTRKVVLE